MIAPPPANTETDSRNYNLPIYGIRGEFTLSGSVKVPYFISLMDLKRATRELKTHEEVSPSLDTQYSLVELFQRTIDIERVKREIVDGYLKDPNKLKFFNSITIALLPKSELGKICTSFEDYPNNNPQIPIHPNDQFDAFFNNPEWQLVVFGGVQFVSTKTANLSRLRWDDHRVDAVAVDGQHRLRALKLWMEGKNNELSDVEKPTRMPVIFLLLNERAGFIHGSGNVGSGIKTIAREIFTDLNKNAREVDLATQIILDDRSIESCCVRSLITDSTCTDHETLLPLSLLRWQEANNRFDQRYFLNSLVGLHLLVEDLLDLEPPTGSDTMDKGKVTTFINNASNRLGLGSPPRIEDRGVDLLQFYQREFLDEEGEPVAPFTGIPSQFLPSAVKGFEHRYSHWLLEILTKLKPYADIIRYAREHNLICGEFGQFLAQPKTHQEQLQSEMVSRHGDRWRNHVIGQHERAIEQIKGTRDKALGEQWAFKAIFQKALVRLAGVCFVDCPESETAHLGKIEDFLWFMNTLHEKGVLRVFKSLPGHAYDLWTFLAVNYGSKKIKVASTSEKRIQALLTLWYFGWRYSISEQRQLVLENPVEGQISTREILSKFGTQSAQIVWPNVKDFHSELMKTFMQSADLISPLPNGETHDEDAKKKLAHARLLAVFNEGLLACKPEENVKI